MYKIEQQDWGLKLTFGGSIDADEMAHWFGEIKGLFEGQNGHFFVFVDMRTLIPLDKAAQIHMREGQELARRRGMVRSVVILDSPVVAAQFKRIGGETGIGKWERYIDASSVSDWESVGMDWLLEANDPDQVKHPTRVS
jgi:hypothetical protein